MNVRRFIADDGPRIDRFNQRLAASGVRWTVYGEGPHDLREGEPVSSRLFVAETADEIRGAVWLREHDFWIRGAPARAGWAKYPVSESLVDQAFGGVPGALLIKLIREQPRLMALGMGGHGGAFARLLKGMRWRGDLVPSFVRIVRPTRVLRRLSIVRRTPARRLLLDALALSGLGWLGGKAVDLVASRGERSARRGVEVTVVERFDAWADSIWERARDRYDFVARRDVAMLNSIYPSTMPVTRLRMSRAGRDIGWACVLRRDLTAKDQTPFGALRVGLVADAFGEPSDADAITAAAVAYLRSTSVDLMFSNQAHPAWGAALKRCGFHSAPSQFAFYRSPKLDAALGDDAPNATFHVNRGDCDGPLFS